MKKKTLFDYFESPSKRAGDVGDILSSDIDSSVSSSQTLVKRMSGKQAEDSDTVEDETLNEMSSSSIEKSFLYHNSTEKSEMEDIGVTPHRDAVKKTGMNSVGRMEKDNRGRSEEVRYGFLVDVMDKYGKRRGEGGYDPSSLMIPPHEYRKFTPFEKQFWDVKKEHFDTIVFFKKGKFYELYEDDALIGARLFDFKVTNRVNMKMSGFPESSLDHWSKKFLEHGYKIARVEQNESMIGKQIREKDEKCGKSLIQTKPREKIIHRELREIISQGTIYSPEHLQSAIPVYLMTAAEDAVCYSDVCCGKIHMSIILYDASTNEVYFSSFCDGEERRRLKTILSQHDVKEVVSDIPISGVNIRIEPDITPVVSDKKYHFSNRREYLCFSYLQNYMKSLKRQDVLESVRVAKLSDDERFMVLDDVTLRNMEIFKNNYNGSDEKTLFKAINFCSTPFGTRLLRRWMMAPLMKRKEILDRQFMSAMFEAVDISSIRGAISTIGDAERNLARLYNGNPTSKDLNKFICCVEASERAFKMIIDVLRGETAEDGKKMFLQKIHGLLEEVHEFLSSYRKVYDVSEHEILPGEESTDELYLLLSERKVVECELEKYLHEQKTRLGCQSLRFRDIGKELFQIEAPKELDVPTEYFVVSSNKATNRYYSLKLKNLVRKYVECEERLFQSKRSLLRRAVEALSKYTSIFHQLFSQLAHVDCYLSFATFAMHNRASVPSFSENLSLFAMSNPVYSCFVENNYVAEKKILILTGPNMGGKSTLLRTICLNIILSQIGMKVCCSRMETPLFDRIFTRIGASDNILQGESTFAVELSETVNILKYSTRRSFVIVDELGRGTSTIDGGCIARAVLEYLKKKESHVMFSTHYHKIIGQIDGVENGYMSSIVKGGEIIFLYKLVLGTSSDSHGLYVARTAGVPDIVVDRAEKIRAELINRNSPDR